MLHGTEPIGGEGQRPASGRTTPDLDSNRSATQRVQDRAYAALHGAGAPGVAPSQARDPGPSGSISRGSSHPGRDPGPSGSTSRGHQPSSASLHIQDTPNDSGTNQISFNRDPANIRALIVRNDPNAQLFLNSLTAEDLDRTFGRSTIQAEDHIVVPHSAFGSDKIKETERVRLREMRKDHRNALSVEAVLNRYDRWIQSEGHRFSEDTLISHLEILVPTQALKTYDDLYRQPKMTLRQLYSSLCNAHGEYKSQSVLRAELQRITEDMNATVFMTLDKIERNLNMTSGSSISERMQRCIEQATLYLKRKLGPTQTNIILGRYEGRGHTTFADLVHLIKNEFYEIASTGVNHDDLIGTEKPSAKRTNHIVEEEVADLRKDLVFAITEIKEMKKQSSPLHNVNVHNVHTLPQGQNSQGQPLGGQIFQVPAQQAIAPQTQQTQPTQDNQYTDKPYPNIQCFKCNTFGHYATTCPSKAQNTQHSTQQRQPPFQVPLQDQYSNQNCSIHTSERHTNDMCMTQNHPCGYPTAINMHYRHKAGACKRARNHGYYDPPIFGSDGIPIQQGQVPPRQAGGHPRGPRSGPPDYLTGQAAVVGQVLQDQRQASNNQAHQISDRLDRHNENLERILERLIETSTARGSGSNDTA